MKYELPKLSYPYNALEPYIDAKTMEIHHAKHHQAYTDKMNAVLEKYPDIAATPIEELLRTITTLRMDEKDKTALKNHGGGFVNHNLFWRIMGPLKEIDTALYTEIERTFVSVADFKKLFSDVAAGHFGSGWAWLVRDEKNALQVYSLPNQDSPLSKGHTPIFCLDVWEHAYYLKYQNRRAEYIENWWSVLRLV